ncbi:DUF357 domain-containing protein [Candidatus Woesearchaeota archaeon]|nr:DUF357 domain-containing protein [Candidatus Woesearchaeota archaeon]
MPETNDKITAEKLEKYLSITKKALEKANSAEKDTKRMEHVNDCIDMATRYYEDALHYKEKGDFVTAFAAVNYAHGWLDAGARMGLFKVEGAGLFTVD